MAFGPMVPPTVIEDLLVASLKAKLPTYLGNIGRLYAGGQDALPAIRSWDVGGDFKKRPGDQLPLLYVTSAGSAATEVNDGDGLYRATFRYEVTVVTGAATHRAADRLSQLYATAIAACLVGESPGAPVEDVIWTGSAPEDMEGDNPVMVAHTPRFDVIAQSVLQRGIGLLTVPDEPRDEPDDDPTVQTVGVVGQRLPVA